MPSGKGTGWKFFSILKSGAEIQLMYPWATLGVIFEYVFGILIFAAVYTTIGKAGLAGLTLNDLILYATGAWFVKAIIPTRRFMEGIEDIVMGRGTVQFLTLPVDPGLYIFVQNLGRALFRAMILIIPVILLAHPARIPFFLLAALLAVTFEGIMLLITGWLTLLVKKGQIVRAILHHLIVGVLGGIFVPLQILPPFLRNLAMSLPFRYIGYAPAMVLIGEMGLDFVPNLLLWILVVSIIYWGVQKVGIKYLELKGV